MSLRLLGIDHVGISAKDVSRTAAFYCDVLGLAPVPDLPLHLTVLRGGSVEIAITAWKPGEPEPGVVPRGDHFALRVPMTDFDVAREVFTTRGVEHHVVDDRIYFKDPDGRTIELQFRPD
jgi:catechol 2,3-dioxygenase-like lactoylglutathione lyase family enzyme